MKKIVTPDIKTGLSIFLTIRFPYALSNLLSSMAERQKKTVAGKYSEGQ